MVDWRRIRTGATPDSAADERGNGTSVDDLLQEFEEQERLRRKALTEYGLLLLAVVLLSTVAVVLFINSPGVTSPVPPPDDFPPANGVPEIDGIAVAVMILAVILMAVVAGLLRRNRQLPLPADSSASRTADAVWGDLLAEKRPSTTADGPENGTS